jgi:hypothetical protein
MVLALVVCGILGLGIGSYLTLVGAQARSVGRSQDWNRTLAISEAGVEEALAQLNPGVDDANVDMTANGWGTPSGGFYGPKSRTLSNDTYTVLYTTNIPPIIYSTGQVSSSSSTLTRVVEVHTAKTYLFTVAMATRLNIDMKGNGIQTDSFDSSNTNLSSNGVYTSSKTSTNGDVASIGGEINVGVSSVNGDVYLGPAASDSVSKNGTISGSIYHDFNADFPDVILPIPVSSFVSVSPLSTATNIVDPTGGSTTPYDYYFASSGDYALTTAGSIYVAPGASVRLYIANSMSPAAIRVAGSGAASGKLQIYMAGASFDLTGQSFVDGGFAGNFVYWGLPSNTSLKFSGNAAFTGVIYAPSADFTLGGGGNSGYDFVGSSITKSTTLNGHYKFHFDEALAKMGPIKGYAATYWREL